VNEEEPSAPDVKVNPVVDASVNVPCETESVSESAFVPTAAASAIEIALLLPLESVKEPFSLREPLPGAEIVGTLKALTVIDTLVEAESVSPASVTETDNESAPE